MVLINMETDPGLQIKGGGYDYKVNETVNVVTAITLEICRKTWGLMKGVIALASQKVEEYTKEGSNWKNDRWEQNEHERTGCYQEFGKESKGWKFSAGAQPSSARQFNFVSSGSWDDWDGKDSKKEDSSKGTISKNGDNLAGCDDGKDDGYGNFYQNASVTRMRVIMENLKTSGQGVVFFEVSTSHSNFLLFPFLFVIFFSFPVELCRELVRRLAAENSL